MQGRESSDRGSSRARDPKRRRPLALVGQLGDIGTRQGGAVVSEVGQEKAVMGFFSVAKHLSCKSQEPAEGLCVGERPMLPDVCTVI